MFGAYILYTLFNLIGIQYVLPLTLSAIILAVFGFIVERLLLRPVRKQPMDVNMLALVGLSMFMANIVQVIWGARPLDTGLPFSLTGIALGPIILTPIRILCPICSRINYHLYTPVS